MKVIKNIYIKDFHGLPSLHADVRYKEYDDENDSKIIIDSVWIRHQYSMGVGHSDFITSLFNIHPSINEEISALLISIIEKN